MRKVRSHAFRGKRWTIKVVPRGSDYEGKVLGPHMKRKVMWVRYGRGHRAELEQLIHESLHACFWDLEEYAVNESGHDMADFLWRLGWRLVPGAPKNLKRKRARANV